MYLVVSTRTEIANAVFASSTVFQPRLTDVFVVVEASSSLEAWRTVEFAQELMERKVLVVFHVRGEVIETSPVWMVFRTLSTKIR